MSAPVDIVEAGLIACIPATIAGAVIALYIGRWSRQTDERLDALESRVADREEAAEVPTNTAAVLGSEEEARWTIARVREVHGHDLAGARFLTIVRQILGVLPRYKPSSDPEARATGRRKAYDWCADYLDEVRGGRTGSPVDDMLEGIARTFRRRAADRHQHSNFLNPMPAMETKRPARLVTAARDALAAYRGIFGTGNGCWNDRDRRAFAELAAVLEDVDHAP